MKKTYALALVSVVQALFALNAQAAEDCLDATRSYEAHSEAVKAAAAQAELDRLSQNCN